MSYNRRVMIANEPAGGGARRLTALAWILAALPAALLHCSAEDPSASATQPSESGGTSPDATDEAAAAGGPSANQQGRDPTAPNGTSPSASLPGTDPNTALPAGSTPAGNASTVAGENPTPTEMNPEPAVDPGAMPSTTDTSAPVMDPVATTMPDTTAPDETAPDMATSMPTATDAPDDEPAPSTWNGAVATALTDATLDQEYANWKTNFVTECPEQGSAVVVKDGGQVVSEGIAYGMLISVNMNDQALFDQLWAFYLDHLDENGLMNWSMGVCDPPGNNMAHAASDAELDALMALLQAQTSWGGDYLEQARALAVSVIEYEVEECDGRTILKPGDVWGGCSDATGETRINPSYFAPGYYRAFATHFPEQAETWNALLEGSYELYPPMQERLDGLFPDWSGYDGSDWFGAGHGWDACRTPWRLAIDYAWSAEPRALSALAQVNDWLAGNGGLATGTMPNNSAFQGAFALASIDGQAALDQAVDTWLNSGGDDGPYFQATLRMLYLLAAAGRFPSTF